jgi:hypothetical protein
VLLPAAIFGTLHHLAPFVLVRGIASRLDQPGRKTVSTNRMMVGAPIYLLWYMAVGWWMFGYFATWFMVTWMIAAPFLGVLALSYWRRAGRTVSLLWHQVRVTLRRGSLDKLRQQEADLREKLKTLADEYDAVAPRPETELRRSKKGAIAWAASLALRLLILATIFWFGRYWFFDKPLSEGGLDLTTFSEPQLSDQLDADEKTLESLIDGIANLEKAAIQLNDDFEAGKRSYTNQRDNDDVRELMRRYIAFRQGLLRIIWKYQRSQHSGGFQNEPLRARAFLVGFTSAAVLKEVGLKFVRMFDKSPVAVAKLNEPEPNWGIPAGLYDTIRRNLASPKNSHMFDAAQRFYHEDQMQELFEKHDLRSSAAHRRFHTAIAGAEESIQELDPSLLEKIAVVALADLGRLFFQVQYETQSAVSTWIGDFKIREPRDGESLIDKEQLQQLGKLLEPGDILLERRNWYLSNAFLPGYWPHGAIYVGTAEDIKRLGLSENEHVQKHWGKFSSKDHEYVIIEAISEGVIFSSLQHSIGAADSVAVLRPNVSDEEKKDAIIRAFSFAGRPYDFEFDFTTTDMLVCTEVVYRAYGGNSGPIDFPLEKIMGRWTMPAINLVRKFDEEYETDDAQFTFVAFIDGDEATGTSTFPTDVKTFRKTLDRPASSFLQGQRPYVLKSISPLGWVLISLTVLCGFVGIGTKLVAKIRSV